MNVEDYFFDEKEFYDKLWLFGKKCWVNIFMCAFSLRFGIEEVAR